MTDLVLPEARVTGGYAGGPGQHLDFDRRFGNRRRVVQLAREVGAVAQVAPAAHHREREVAWPDLARLRPEAHQLVQMLIKS